MELTPQLVENKLPLESTGAITTPEETPIRIDNPEPTTSQDPEVLNQRFFKTSFGLFNKPIEIPPQQLKEQFDAGKEGQVREQLSSDLNLELSQQRSDRLMSLAAQNIPTEEMLQKAQQEFNGPFFYEPKSVIERRYSEQYMSELDRYASKLGDGTFWKEFMDQFPTKDQLLVKQTGTMNMAKYQYLQKTLEDLQAQMTGQSYAKDVTDQFKLLFPWFNPYYETQMRGNVDNIYGSFLGENMERQRTALWDKKFDDFTATVDQIKAQAPAGNPYAVAAFFQAMLGQSSQDKMMNNVNTVFNGIDAATLFGFGWRGIRGGVTKTQAAKAVQDVVEASTRPNATKADISASIGDVPTAAIEETTKHINDTATGKITPDQEAKDTLTRFLQWDKDNSFNSAALTDAQKNILKEQTEAGKGFLTDLEGTVRPSRVPMETYTPEQLKEISAKTMSRYPDMSNNILHIADAERDALPNTFTVRASIGRNATEMFSDPAEAVGFASRKNYRVTLAPEELTAIDSRIAQLKEEVRAVRMDEDTAGLNRYFDVEKEIKDLEKTRADLAKPGGYKVRQQGLGWVIDFEAKVKETDRIIRDLMFRPENPATVSPDSWTNAFRPIAYMRTAEDTMAPQMRAMRKTAIYPQGKIAELAAEEGKLIANVFKGAESTDPVTGEKIPWYRSKVPVIGKFLAKDEWKSLNETLVHNQKIVDPEDGITGYYYKNYDELNHHYLSAYGRSPSWAETQAYFAVKRWAEYDRMLREVAMYRNYARLGGETHQIMFTGHNEPDVKSPPFNGVTRDTFPSGNGNILIATDNRFTSEVKDLRYIPVKTKEAMKEQVLEGKMRLVQVIDPEKLPFDGVVKNGDRRIEWVLAPNIETRPLSWEQVPRRGGGHLVYDYDFYIKQPRVKSETLGESLERGAGSIKHWYEGDQTLFPVKIRAMGEDYAGKMNTLRKMLKDENFDAAKDYLATSKLGISWQDLKNMFFEHTVDETGTKVKPSFSLDYDFQVLPKNKTTLQVNKALKDKFDPHIPPSVNDEKKYGTFIDGTKTGSLARNFQVEFTGERDSRGMFTIENRGTVENPIYETRDAELVSPLETMTRSLSKIIRSSFFEDYKIAAVEHLLQEAIPHMVTDRKQVEASPFYHFRNLNENSFLSGAPKDQVNKILANKFKIEQLIGQPSKFESAMHEFGQNVTDIMYNKFGPNRMNIVPLWLMDRIKDPIDFIRSATFNVYLGFGYLAQFFIQMQSYSNIYAHAPRYATMATYGSYLHNLARMTREEAVIADLDLKATKMNIPGLPKYKPGWFKEAHELIRDSGFRNVGGEYGALDIPAQAKIVEGAYDRGSRMLQFAFREGERQPRINAFYTAHLEWREANPTKKMTRTDQEKILDKADMYYNNMSVASHSVLNSGPLSLATQFVNYQRQLGEIFWSGTGRTGETLADRNLLRARMFAVNSILYGIPAGMGVTGFALHDYMRRSLLEGEAKIPVVSDMTGAKIPLGEPYTTEKQSKSFGDWVKRLGVEGGIHTIDYALTGKSRNYGQRWGALGVGQVNDILSGDTTFWKMIAGPSAGWTSNFYGELSHQLGALIHGDPQDPKHVPKPQDFVDLASQASQSVNKTNQLYTALNTGIWAEKNYGEVMKTGPIESTWMYLTGTSPSAQADARLIVMNLKDQQAAQREGMKYIEREVNKWFLALRDNNPEQADDYLRRAHAMRARYGLDVDQMSNAVARAMKDQGSMIQKVAWERYIKNAPDHLREKMEKTYSTIFNSVEGKQ